MKKPLLKLLSGIAVFCFAFVAPVSGVTIVPTFDTSITNDPNGAAMTNAIIFSIQTLQSNLTGNLTVLIHFTNDASAGLGQSSTWESPYSYGGYLSALRNSATSMNDSNALSQIPNSPTDPLAGNSQIQLKLPLARLMGLDSGYGPDGYDSTIGLNMALISPTRPPGPTLYDLIGTVEHEMNEVLGFGSNLKNGYPAGPIGPMDLYRYTTNLVRTWTTNGDNAYFSVDGTNLLARFNQDPGGDYHDWWSAAALWAPPGQTPHVQVQDAFGTPGNIQDEGPNELAGLDVIGYTLVSVTPPAPPLVLTIVRSGVNQFTVGWPTNYNSYVLQERTNLVAGLWANSVSGSTNPSVIVSTATQKFYRLHQQVLVLLAEHARTIEISTNSALRLVTHVYQPGKP